MTLEQQIEYVHDFTRRWTAMADNGYDPKEEEKLCKEADEFCEKHGHHPQCMEELLFELIAKRWGK